MAAHNDDVRTTLITGLNYDAVALSSIICRIPTPDKFGILSYQYCYNLVLPSKALVLGVGWAGKEVRLQSPVVERAPSALTVL